MNYIDNRINQIISHLNSFTLQEFKNEIVTSGIDLSEKSINRVLTNLIKKQIIVRESRNKYRILKNNVRLDFNYELSEFASGINLALIHNYPLIDYQIWELSILNHFFNHLIGHNCIFVDVENDSVDTVFEFLQEKGYRVLLNPTEEFFFLYSLDNIVVVRKLISQAPGNLIDSKKICLERLLVDIAVDKLLLSMINHSEIPEIYHECLSKYNISTKKIGRYASRRNAREKIEHLIYEG